MLTSDWKDMNRESQSAVEGFRKPSMTLKRKLSMTLIAMLLACCGLASSQTVAPRIFFTDLTSGPNSGGETVNGFSGAYVTIYGNNFGSSQGSSTITLNGSSCMRVVSWGTSWLWYQKVVVQLGSSCSSGKFAMVVNGQSSTSATINVGGSTIDPATFAVRTGGIYCVSKSGSDSNSGKLSI